MCVHVPILDEGVAVVLNTITILTMMIQKLTRQRIPGYCRSYYSVMAYVRLTKEPSSTSVDDLELCLKEHTSLDMLDDDNKSFCQKCTANRKSDSYENV